MEITYHGNHSADDGASDEEQGRAPRLQRRLTSKRLSVRKKLKIIEPSASTDAESEGTAVLSLRAQSYDGVLMFQ